MPAAISGSRQVMRKHSLLIYSGTIAIRLGTPIPVQSLTLADRDRLMKDTWDTLAGMIGSAQQAISSD